MTCGIYKIKNNINGKLYIGQSVNIEIRWHNHKKSNRPSHLYYAFKKYGVDNFTFSIICECPESSLDEYEISYIKYYETTDPKKGYNKMSGGSNGRHSEETKNKISIAQKGKPKNNSNDVKIKKSKSMEGNKFGVGNKSNTGRNASDEHRKKLSKVQSERNSNAKSIEIDGIKYNCVKDFANIIGIPYTTIVRYINNGVLLSKIKKRIGVNIQSLIVSNS